MTKTIMELTDVELTDALRDLNPAAHHRPPRNEYERRAMQETLARYRERAADDDAADRR